MDTELTHNHPPKVGIITDCEYCARYGNIFQNGDIKKDSIDLGALSNMYAFKNNLGIIENETVIACD